MITAFKSRAAAPPPAGTEMESDADALYWFDGQALSGTPGASISSWADATGNGMDLSQHTTVTVPTLNATSDGLAFDGTQALADLTAGISGRMIGALDGGGEIALFAVLELDASGVAASQVAYFSPFHEGSTGDGSFNQTMNIELLEDTFSSPSTGSVGMNVQRWSPAVSTSHNPGSSYSGQKLLFEFWCDQSNWEMLVDGVVVTSGTPTPADFPNDAASVIVMGGRGNSSVVWQYYTGEVFSIFATSNADSAHRSAVRADMESRYGL